MKDGGIRKAGGFLPEKKGTITLLPPENKVRLRLHSATLFACSREVIIEHEGEEYRLYPTSKGKLIRP